MMSFKKIVKNNTNILKKKKIGKWLGFGQGAWKKANKHIFKH